MHMGWGISAHCLPSRGLKKVENCQEATMLLLCAFLTLPLCSCTFYALISIPNSKSVDPVTSGCLPSEHLIDSSYRYILNHAVY